MSDSQDIYCSTHSENLLEFFCSDCKKTACRDCKHILSCHQHKHEMISISTAVDKFNKNATDVTKIGEDIKHKLEETFDTIFNDKADFECNLKLCRRAIEIQTETIIEKVKQRSNELLLDLENIYQGNEKARDVQIKDLDLMQDEVNHLKKSIKSIMNKPEETKTLELHEKNMIAIRDKILRNDIYQSFHKRNITPKFFPSTQLNELITKKSLGEIKTINTQYRIVDDEKVMCVTEGEPFEVDVSSTKESDACQFDVNLKNTTGKESATEVEYKGSGKYIIKARCSNPGSWRMVITVGGTHIKGSPVNVIVEKIGLIKTIENPPKIVDKGSKMLDVVLDKEGFILVSKNSKEILKLNQTGSYSDKIQVGQNVHRMHTMSNGLIVYSCKNINDIKCVLCDDKFKEIRSFGSGILQCSEGITVNEESRVLYVADYNATCVFKFNVDTGELLGMIDTKGCRPSDVALTKDGHVIIAEFENHKIHMFDANGKFIRILVDSGKEDGKVWGPCGVHVDADENIIISSNHKLQLFNINGIFIKRIDDEDDGLNVPVGITVICNRRVAVANYKTNNLKIFNY